MRWLGTLHGRSPRQATKMRKLEALVSGGVVHQTGREVLVEYRRRRGDTMMGPGWIHHLDCEYQLRKDTKKGSVSEQEMPDL